MNELFNSKENFHTIKSTIGEILKTNINISQIDELILDIMTKCYKSLPPTKDNLMTLNKTVLQYSIPEIKNILNISTKRDILSERQLEPIQRQQEIITERIIRTEPERIQNDLDKLLETRKELEVIKEESVSQESVNSIDIIENIPNNPLLSGMELLKKKKIKDTKSIISTELYGTQEEDDIKTVYIDINSSRRNFFNYPTSNPFQIRFNVDFDNIKSFEITEIIVPNIKYIIYEPYIILTINEVNSAYINNNIIGKFYIKSYHPQLSFIRLEPNNNEIIIPTNKFDKLTFTLKTVSGQIIDFGKDIYKINSIKRTNDKLLLETNSNLTNEKIYIYNTIQYDPIGLNNIKITELGIINNLTRIHADNFDFREKISKLDIIIIDGKHYNIHSFNELGDIIIYGVIKQINNISYTNSKQSKKNKIYQNPSDITNSNGYNIIDNMIPVTNYNINKYILLKHNKQIFMTLKLKL